MMNASISTAGEGVDPLDEIAELEDGWAGQGSVAPFPEIVNMARMLRDGYALQDWDVTPNDNGTISFENQFSAIEIGRTRLSSYVRTSSGRIFINANIEFSPPPSEGGIR